MTLTFLGTRGNIDVRSRRHQRHTSTLVSHGRARVMIDCGDDWLRHVRRLTPSAIVVTHAHADHVGGLKAGVACTVYATTDVWKQIETWPIDHRIVVRPYQPIAIGNLVFEPVPVRHSVRAPAVGYRIRCGHTVVFYVPDVLAIPDHDRAFANVSLYVGDGASLQRPIQRRHDGTLVGHASIVSQIAWCAGAGIPRAIFTHCGTGIVTHARETHISIRALSQRHGLETRVAYDGLEVELG